MTLPKIILSTTGAGYFDLESPPNFVAFNISPKLVDMILELREILETKALSRIEKSALDIEFYTYHPETEAAEAMALGDNNVVNMESKRIVILPHGFYFKAYVKHTDMEICARCETQEFERLLEMQK